MARHANCDPFTLPDEDLVELLACILTRRSPAGALQSLAPASLRDQVQLQNMLHAPPPGKAGSHDAEVNDYLGGGD